MLVERITIGCTRADIYERLDHRRRPSNSPHLVHDDSHVGVSVCLCRPLQMLLFMCYNATMTAHVLRRRKQCSTSMLLSLSDAVEASVRAVSSTSSHLYDTLRVRVAC